MPETMKRVADPTGVEPDVIVVYRKRTPVQRLGCGAAVLLWFVLLSVPCICIFTAVQGQFTLPLGGAPGQELRVWLVNEPQERGFGLSTGTAFAYDAGQVCVQTDIRFLFWQGEGDEAQYCDCYARASDAAEWGYVDSTVGACSASAPFTSADMAGGT